MCLSKTKASSVRFLALLFSILKRIMGKERETLLYVVAQGSQPAAQFGAAPAVTLLTEPVHTNMDAV